MPPLSLPPGRPVTLPQRGTTFVREAAGPAGAPTVLLLHGWCATADLNWGWTFGPLAGRYNVVALDQRGHGRGIRSRRPFTLARCADDAAALLRELGTGPVIAVGYSMGGPVAQLLWRRHPSLVQGLVLCATSRTFAGSSQEKLWFTGIGGLALGARLMPRAVHRQIAARLIGRRADDPSLQGWVYSEMERHDWTAILEAGRAIGRFDSRGWIGGVDVPTAVVATMQDEVVHPTRQLKLAASIPGATLHQVHGGHAVCATNPRRLNGALLDACRSVASRASRAPAGSPA